MLGKIRQNIKPIAEAIARPIAATGISPDAFSFIAVPLAILAAYSIAGQDFILGLIFTLLAISIDLFDGAVARLQNRQSLFGNYLETMIDKAVETTLFVGTAFLFPIAAVCALGFSMLASYAKPRLALVIISDNRDWPAIGEHAERMLLLFAGIALSAFSVQIAGMKILEISLWLVALVALIGTCQRIMFAKGLIAEAEKKGAVLPYLKKAKGKKSRPKIA